MIEWKPIDTAPNHGKDILVWSPFRKKVEVVKAEGNLWRYQIDGKDNIRFSMWAEINTPNAEKKLDKSFEY